MRIVIVGLICLGWAALAGAQDKDKAGERYKIKPNPDAYPQDKPETALKSVLKAMRTRRIDYLLAQLSDPRWVDGRVRLYDGNFDEVVKETTNHLAEDPTLVKALKSLAKNGKWTIEDKTAAVFEKDKDKGAFFRKIGNRWYLENRQTKKKP
jgi:hypothetical protein